MEIVFINHRLDEENIDLVVHHNIITGIINDENNKIFDLISLKKIGKGQIVINNEKIVKEDLIMNQRRISQVLDKLTIPNYVLTVQELMMDNIKRLNLNIRDIDKKMKDSLKIVGLKEEYVYHEIRTLSSSEKKLISIAIGLLSNPDTLILEEPFKNLDLKQEKRLFMLLQKLKEKYNKTIVIKTEDANILYQYSDEIVVVKNNNILMSGDTKENFHRVDFLKRNGINIPDSVKFIYLAKKTKGAKIDYHSDIRDIIKDIYKHV